MRDFITCLEFLTRVRFSKRTDWRDEDFSRSVPYFPLVGLVIGFLLAAINYSLFYIETPLFLRVTLLLLAEIIITGGLMYDGFMDTADGVFSARSRERMLEIREAEQLYKIMGEVFKPDSENPCYVISPHEDFERFFGKKADKKRKLYNCIIKCNLYIYFK